MYVFFTLLLFEIDSSASNRQELVAPVIYSQFKRISFISAPMFFETNKTSTKVVKIFLVLFSIFLLLLYILFCLEKIKCCLINHVHLEQ